MNLNYNNKFGINKICEYIFIITILISVSIAIYQFFFNRSLWIDEAMLSLNLLDKDFRELLLPLDYNQVAPIGFLFIAKLFVIIFGENELALRALPFLSYLATIPIFFLISKIFFADRIFALFSTALYSISLNSIYYASECKQYSTDIFVSLFIIYVSLNYKNTKSYSTFFSIVGILSIWLSNISVIILFTTGIILILNSLKAKNSLLYISPIAAWVLSFIIYYIYFIHNHPSRDMMVSYWDNSFMPLNPFNIEFYKYMNRAIWLLTDFVNIPLPAKLLKATFVLAIIFLFQAKRYKPIYYSLTPIATHLILSGLHLYPFDKRLILYTNPLVALIFALFLILIFQKLRPSIRKWITLIISLCLISRISYSAIDVLPIKREEIKESLIYVDAHKNDNDPIYIHHGAIPQFKFYSKIKFVNYTNPIVYGIVSRDDYNKYIEDALKIGGDFWLIFSHVHTNSSNAREDDYIIKELKKSGLNIKLRFETKGSSAYLFSRH